MRIKEPLRSIPSGRKEKEPSPDASKQASRKASCTDAIPDPSGYNTADLIESKKERKEKNSNTKRERKKPNHQII